MYCHYYNLKGNKQFICKKISSYTGYVKQLFIHKDEGGSKDPPESLVLQSVQEKLREKQMWGIQKYTQKCNDF